MKKKKEKEDQGKNDDKIVSNDDGFDIIDIRSRSSSSSQKTQDLKTSII